MRRLALFAVAALAIGAAAPSPTDNRLAFASTWSEAAGTWTAITAGERHTCALTSAGDAYCWGDHVNSQLGAPGWDDATSSSKPVPVQGGLKFTALSTFENNTCGITTAAVAYCWGANELGQGGYQGKESAKPRPVAGGLKFSSISAGWLHTCGITTDGGTYCWGNNLAGQLGMGSTSAAAPFISTPTRVAGDVRFMSVSAGAQHTCGIATDGSAHCWGENRNFERGPGSTKNHKDVITEPMSVAGGLKFAAISAGSKKTCGLTAEGAAYCWGYIVDAEGNFSRHSPTPMSQELRFKSLSARGSICGVTTEGTLSCMGDDFVGLFADPPIRGDAKPMVIFAGLRFTALSMGYGHICGVSVDGTAYCGGDNARGQLGGGLKVDAKFAAVKVLDPVAAVPKAAKKP